MYSFERLEVWSVARGFVSDIYVCTKNFPSKEKFGLCSQLERSAVSIMSNIAEGTSRTSCKEKIRFIEIAFGSLMENYNQLYVSLDQKYITDEHFKKFKDKIDSLARMLNSLKNSYQQKL
ncbi:MAG: four helix bundle protein [Lentimicrobiaceae bacterium]|nr:four helix bundle protein [Lentimicrobiaceae bacterium]